MPLVKKRLSIAAGATSDQVLAGTTYESVSYTHLRAHETN